MPTNLKIWNKRMLLLMEIVIKTNKVNDQGRFLDMIGFSSKYNFNSQILTGKQSFRHEHIHAACKIWGINANWIYGLSEHMRADDGQVHDPFSIIIAELKRIEDQFTQSKTVKKKK